MVNIKNGLTYNNAGVDIDAGYHMVNRIKPLARMTRRSGADSKIGGFGGIFDLKAAGFKDPLLIAANDGVGTKLRVAIETGIHHTIGIDLVAMCVNDLIVQGAEPLFFLDYFATGKLNPEQGADIIKGIVEGCIQAGCALIGGETAEMPGIYHNDDYDLAGFAVGACERLQLLPNTTLSDGDILLGLASSGIHSNGFSMVRKIIEINNLSYHDPAPFNNTREGQTLGECLLEPTRIYVKSILHTLSQTRAIKALAHITGGGFYENIPRILPNHLTAEINLDGLCVPDVFSWLSEAGNIDMNEMLRIFNCGIGMVIITDKDNVQTVSEALIAKGEDVIQLGSLIPRDRNQGLTYCGQLAL